VGQQLAGTLLIALPNATEANPLCPINAQAVWPITGQSSARTLGCTVVRTGWGLGVLALWAVAAALAVGTLRALRRLNPAGSEWLPGDRRCAVQQTARLAVLGSAGLTLLLYAGSSVAARVPWGTTHYLLGLLVAAPAGLAPLWPEPYPFKLLPRAAGSVRTARVLWRGRYVPLALLALTLTLGTGSTFQLVKGRAHST